MKIVEVIKKYAKNPIPIGILFCVFNWIYFFLAFMLCGVSILDFGRGMNVQFMLIVNLNLLIPVCATILYIKNKTYRNFGRVFRLFFGIELPLVILCVLRIFLLREITPFMFVILLSIIVAVLVQVAEYYKIKRLKNPKVIALGYETTAILGVYGFILSSFFVLPFLLSMLISFLSFDWFNELISAFSYEYLYELPAIIMSTLIICLLLGLFLLVILSPFISVVLYIKNFIKYTKRLADKRIFAVFAVLYVFVLALLSIQPSEVKISENIQKYRQISGYEEKIEFAKNTFKNKEFIYKKILGDKYIAKYKYFADKTYSGVEDLHDRDGVGQIYQNMFNVIAFPFMYNGEFNPSSANIDYQEIFDDNIQSAQKQKIRKALYSTLFRSDISALALDKDAKSVLLKSRTTEVFTNPDSPVAHVNITEEYFNTDTTDKEVFYYLTLPQGSVVVDLKLGKELEYQGEISTKGAARKTYEQQVVNRHDPALLEKNGLRQYTLRVYPVQSKDSQKVSYSYITTIGKNGEVGLPDIYEKRNVYENRRTKYSYLVNKKTIKNVHSNIINTDLKTLPLPVCSYVQNNLYCYKETEVTAQPENKKIAMLLDTSYSNKISWEDFLENDSEYQKIKDKNVIDIYFFNDLVSTKIDLDNVTQYNIGKTKRLDAIKAVGKNYDIVIMLTDGDEYDDSKRSLSDINVPLYIIHADGKIPPYYNELSLSILKTNGKIANDIKDVINDYYIKQNLSGVYSDGDVILTKEAKTNAKIINNSDFTKFIYSKLIDDNIAKKDLSDISVLDEIHRIAKTQGIVTSYSSYIALVNMLQKETLKGNEESSDRYDANLQSGIDKIVNEGDGFVEDIQSVPEPEQWAMIILGTVLLLFIYMKRNVICKKD